MADIGDSPAHHRHSSIATILPTTSPGSEKLEGPSRMELPGKYSTLGTYATKAGR
jgi:hypothetical protein